MFNFSVVRHKLGAIVLKDEIAVAIFPYMKSDHSPNHVVAYTEKLKELEDPYGHFLKPLVEAEGFDFYLNHGSSKIFDQLLQYYNHPPLIKTVNHIETQYRTETGLQLLNTITGNWATVHFRHNVRDVVKPKADYRKVLHDPTGNYSAVALLDKGIYGYTPLGSFYDPV